MSFAAQQRHDLPTRPRQPRRARARCRPPCACRGSATHSRLLAAVVLHFAGYDLPVLSVPSVHVTAIRTGPIAVPDLAFMSRTRLERGV